MWNLKDINTKKNYVTEQLKNCSIPKEKKLYIKVQQYFAIKKTINVSLLTVFI